MVRCRNGKVKTFVELRARRTAPGRRGDARAPHPGPRGHTNPQILAEAVESSVKMR